eukprot:3579484-Amphidinium_carterae.1
MRRFTKSESDTMPKSKKGRPTALSEPTAPAAKSKRKRLSDALTTEAHRRWSVDARPDLFKTRD